MKIILTHSEAVAKLKSYLECENVTIETDYTAYPERPNFPILEAVRLVKRIVGYNSHNKIPAIKAVREFAVNNGFSLGLADAKNFVESI